MVDRVSNIYWNSDPNPLVLTPIWCRKHLGSEWSQKLQGKRANVRWVRKESELEHINRQGRDKADDQGVRKRKQGEQRV